MTLTEIVTFSFILFPFELELDFDVDLLDVEVFFDDVDLELFFHLFEGFHFEFPFEVDLFELEFFDVELGFFQLGFLVLGFFQLVFFELDFLELELGFFQLDVGFFELEFFSGLSPNVSPFSHRPCDKLSFGFFATSFCLLVLHFGLLPPGFLNQGLLLQYGLRKLSFFGLFSPQKYFQLSYSLERAFPENKRSLIHHYTHPQMHLVFLHIDNLGNTLVLI